MLHHDAYKGLAPRDACLSTFAARLATTMDIYPRVLACKQHVFGFGETSDCQSWDETKGDDPCFCSIP